MQAPSLLAERRVQRLSATIPVSLLLAREDYTTEFDAYTVDVSHKGLRVRTNFALFPGDMIGIAPGTESEAAIPSRVVWAQRSALGGSLAGLEFLDVATA
jgi:hypothetical protein